MGASLSWSSLHSSNLEKPPGLCRTLGSDSPFVDEGGGEVSAYSDLTRRKYPPNGGGGGEL